MNNQPSQLNLLWAGLEYFSLENCLVDLTSTGSKIQSTILGYYEGQIYRVDYSIRTDQDWATRLLNIDFQHNSEKRSVILEGDGKGNWHYNGAEATQFQGCLDVDLPLTPFTNTLPINRLKLSPGETQEIGVIYCDVLSDQIKPVRQQYTCLSRTAYHYQNIPNDFEATLQVDQGGFVVDYPSLFRRKAALNTNYR